MSRPSAGGVEGGGETRCGGGDGSEEVMEHQRMKSVKHKVTRKEDK